MDTILLFQHMDNYGSRLRLEGLNKFAKEIGWDVQCYEEQPNEQSLQLLRGFWHPVGSILSANDGITEFNASLFSPDNTVLLDSFPPGGLVNYASVITDSFTVAELATRELLAAKCASYAFVPWPNVRLWSENRRHNYNRILARHNIKPYAFVPSRPGLKVWEIQEELVPWLQSLPKPCGILAANDRVGENVLHACHLAGINVPFECAVVGVDDNSEVCESTNPTLSSVCLNFKMSGYTAGKLLHQLITGQRKDRPILSTPLIGFTRRNSSRVFLQTDRHALMASERIRAKACSGLLAREVLDLFPCSRRLAEIRFRKATGHSVLDEIREVRIEHAKQLLRNPFQRLDAIAEQCGYESDTTFRRIFKQETGMTLREYQKSLKNGTP